MKKIAFLGAWSIDNTGDQLLGYAARQAFRELAPAAEHVLLAPALRGDVWRHAWNAERGLGLDIKKLAPDDSTKWARGFDAVVIGGGGIIRLEPDFRPFLLGEAADWNAKVPAAWNAVGAEGIPAYLASQRAACRAVKRCCETLAYTSVRNAASARFLRQCGWAGAVHVVPDPSLLMTLPDAGADRGERLLAEAGVDTGRFVIGVSVGASVKDPRAAFFYRELFSAIAAVRDAAVVLFPFGQVYGDTDLQRVAREALPGARLIEAPLGALDRWRLAGALDFYVCTRYHATLAAFAQDVPFLVLDEYVSDAGGTSKNREFVVENDLDALYLCPQISTRPRQKLENAIELAREGALSFAPRLAALRADLLAHYARMIGALGLR